MSGCGAVLEQPAGVDAPATVLARPSSFDRLPALPPELGKLSADRACAVTHPSRCRFHRRPLTTGTALMDGASLPPGLSDVPNRSPRKGSVCHSQPSPYAGGCLRSELGGRPLDPNDTHPRRTSTYQANRALSALDSRSARFAWGSTFGSRAARPSQEGPSRRFRRRTRSCPGPVTARSKALRASAESPLRGLGST